jgi:hypothetical protein
MIDLIKTLVSKKVFQPTKMSLKVDKNPIQLLLKKKKSTPKRVSSITGKSTPKRVSSTTGKSTPKRVTSTTGKSTPKRVTSTTGKSTPKRVSSPIGKSTPKRVTSTTGKSTPNGKSSPKKIGSLSKTCQTNKPVSIMGKSQFKNLFPDASVEKVIEKCVTPSLAIEEINPRKTYIENRSITPPPSLREVDIPQQSRRCVTPTPTCMKRSKSRLAIWGKENKKEIYSWFVINHIKKMIFALPECDRISIQDVSDSIDKIEYTLDFSDNVREIVELIPRHTKPLAKLHIYACLALKICS